MRPLDAVHLAVLVLAAWVGLLYAPDRAGAADRHVVFGDSIAAGNSWPSTCSKCPVIFDCTGGCADLPFSARQKCGHGRRLDNWLGGGVDVKVQGRGAENTAEGLSRMSALDGTNYCNGTPGNCISVILMEGTNDPNSGIGANSTKANLASMIDIAEGMGVEVVLLTIIQHVDCRNGANSGDCPTWTNINDKIRQLENEKDVILGDTASILCTPGDVTCFRENYFVSDATGQTCSGSDDDNLGHLDPDGFDDLTDDILKPLWPGSAPGAPAPTAPSGEIGTFDPLFTFPEVSSATWYDVSLDGGTSWHKEAADCSGGTCSIDLGTLAAGPHTWKVRGRNLRGRGSFSADLNFDVTAPTATPTGSVPTGSFCGTSPTYTWNEIANSTSYDVQVDNGGGTLFTETFGSGAVCGGGTCATAASTPLADGDHSWQVRGKNDVGDGSFSTALDFTVANAVPTAASLSHPLSEVFDDTPLFVWQEVVGATSYDLEVDSSIVQTYSAASVCSGGVCSADPGNSLSLGAHDWRVHGTNLCGSDAPTVQPFEVVSCTAGPLSLTGTESGTATHDICDQIDVADTATYTITDTGDVTLHVGSGGVVTFFDGFTAEGLLTVITEP